MASYSESLLATDLSHIANRNQRTTVFYGLGLQPVAIVSTFSVEIGTDQQWYPMSQKARTPIPVDYRQTQVPTVAAMHDRFPVHISSAFHYSFPHDRPRRS